VRTAFRFESLKGTYHSEDTGVDGRIILVLKWIVGKGGLGLRIGFVRLRNGIGEGLL
jgi:hypothetical protein